MDAADLSDLRKIRLVQAGQVEFYEPLVRKYMRRAHGVAMQFVQDTEDALELAQDAFLKTFRAIDRFDTDQRFFPWFYRILKNTCISHLRKRRRPRTTSLSGSFDDERAIDVRDEGARSPHDQLENDELRLQFLAALGELQERDREILVLRHFQDLQYHEIAATLEIPIGTVMSRLFHARRRLRERLGDRVLDEA
jgi:RNA polymerase sigma-70 factor (ECF subfamily)